MNQHLKIFSFFLVLFSFFIIAKSIQQNEKILGVENEAPNSEDRFEGSLDIYSYKVSWFESDGSNISLIPNFDNKSIFRDLLEENNCLRAINASFYDKDNSPIGLFISEGEQLSNFEKNKLFNGILSINRFDTPRITQEVPRDPLVSAIQSGPLLLLNDSYIPYQSSTDKKSRRMIAAVSGENKMIFLSIYNKESVFMGPKLSELTDILKSFEEITNINLADALNLDGGSASAFSNGQTTLSEISPVGSIFCIK